MAELLIDFITTLDGYRAAEGCPGGWGSKVPSTWVGWGSSQKVDFRAH